MGTLHNDIEFDESTTDIAFDFEIDSSDSYYIWTKISMLNEFDNVKGFLNSLKKKIIDLRWSLSQFNKIIRSRDNFIVRRRRKSPIVDGYFQSSMKFDEVGTKCGSSKKKIIDTKRMTDFRYKGNF
jgi:hypothetical protein